MPTITISDKGQITLPAQVRRLFGLEPHGKIDLEVHEEAIVLRPSRTIRSVRGVFSHLKEGGRSSDWETVRTKTERQIAEETNVEDR